jgi:hypothetical protein
MPAAQVWCLLIAFALNSVECSTPKQLIQNMNAKIPGGFSPANTLFQREYKAALKEMQALVSEESTKPVSDLKNLEEKLVSRTIELIKTSEGKLIDLDRGVASELAWGLLDWALNELKHQGVQWESIPRCSQYNEMRKYAIANSPGDKDGLRFIAKTIQAIFTNGYRAGISYAEDKCETLGQ